MKKILLFIILTTFLTSCDNNLESRFRKKFKEILTNEQIDLILKINSDFDKIVIAKYPENTKDLKSCYVFMTETIKKKGDYSDYFHSKSKLIELKKMIIDVGLFDENKNKYYLKSLTELSKDDKEIKELIDYLSGSGYYYLSSSFLELGKLSHHRKMNSISKILLTFNFVLGQIEETTTANNV